MPALAELVAANQSETQNWVRSAGFGSTADAIAWMQSTCYERVKQAVLPLGVQTSDEMLLLQPHTVAELSTILPVFRKQLTAILASAVTADQRVQRVLSNHEAWLDANLGASTPGDLY